MRKEESSLIENPAKRRMSRWAVWSFVLAILAPILGMFATIPAIICGHVARSKIKKAAGSLAGRGLACAGLAVGYIVFVLQVIVLFLMLRSWPSLFPPTTYGTRDKAELAQAILASPGMSLEEPGRMCFQPLIRKDTPIGIVVGTLWRGEKEVHRYGNPEFDGNTIFEIGSVTKVFTCLALSVLADNGQVELSDPITKYLPEDVHPPAMDSSEIQLVHLATHTSGLPRVPKNMSRWRGVVFGLTRSNNPYAGYDTEKLYAAVRGTRLRSEPGARYEYSNFGAGLLGQLLANAAGAAYESLIRESVCTPLNTPNTFVTVPPGVRGMMAPPYLKTGRPTVEWDCEALVGAGGLRSNVNDLLTFLHAHMYPEQTKLEAPIRSALTKRFQEDENNWVGLGWHCKKDGDHEFWWHNGGTGGYASFVGMDRETEVAIAVLGNADFYREITEAGFDFLPAVTTAAGQPDTR